MSGGERAVNGPRRDWWLDAGLLFLLSAVLVLPLFRIEYLNNWGSIEPAFMSNGRTQAANWFHHLWQPLWYCGTRADYVYPPGLSYAIALVTGMSHISTARAYHILVGVIYAFGIVAVYLWTRAATQSRGAAWLAAAGAALISPCYLVVPEVRADVRFLAPFRLHVLMTYGEGPHMSSFALLPVVWLAAWRRFRGGGRHWLLLGAAAASAVVTINFYGATALAITFPLLAWACFLERRDGRIIRDSALLVALAYGLTAFWLTPSYLSVTGHNLRMVANPDNAWSRPVAAAIVVLFVAASFGFRRLQRYSPYSFFIWSGFGFMSLYTLGYRWLGLQIAGNSPRLYPELDLFAILCGVELAARLWARKPAGVWRLAPRVALVLLLVLCFRPAWRYAKHVYSEFPEDRQWRERPEYQTPNWLAQHFPDQRVWVTGSVRFWYNTWLDGLQADGNSQQGILNLLLTTPQWHITHSNDPELTRHWLQAMGVDLLWVPEPDSKEPYKDYTNAQMYAASLPLVRDDGEGNRYYRVPRRVTGIVRVVDQARVAALAPVPRENETAALGAYVEAIEAAPHGGAAPEPARARWLSSDALDVEAGVQPGEALLVEENYDPYWRASMDGHPLTIVRDPVGFMLVQLPPGHHRVHLEFQTPREVTVGRTLTGASLLLIGFFAIRRRPT